jgi:hypothetical protein
MNWHQRKSTRISGKLGLVTASLGLAFLPIGEAWAQSSFAGNAQHTAEYAATAQNLNAIHWTTAIDLNNTGGFAHYGAPVITPANTIFVPVKTGPTSGFEINVFNGGTGAAIYTLSTDYISPSSQWIVPYQPVLATNSMETRLYYPGAGGTVYYIDNVDSASHGAPVQQVFYTSLANYQANAAGFNSTVFIDTPITADSSGNVFFGFRVQGTAPAPLSTTQSGYARIDPNGNAIYALAGTAAGDANIAFDSHSAAPAVSNDQSTVYVVVKSASADSSYGYLLGLNATTLATKYKVFLKDPRGNNANNATLLDISTASPMVGPDNDVYFGIYGNPANGSRGFLLHFSGDLTVEKAPGGFGWDYTPGVVPASMVPSYTGTSSYLLFTKYNNYANAGGDSADGVNRVAVLDPTSTEVDAHASSNGMAIMREVLTVIGPAADQENRSASLPYAVREWCINTPGVNPATNSVFVPSEDGHIYRWNLVTNSLDQFVQLSPGLGEPYVPTIVGPDGTVFTLNGGLMSAAGSLNGVGVAIASSMPDVRTVVNGQSLTFSVAVTNTGNSGITPTGTVTVHDTVYYVPSPGVLQSTTITLASNLPLDVNGNASLTTSALTVDKHFITVSYSGDSNFSTGNASLIQIVHASGTTTTLTSLPNPSTPGQQVTFTATVSPNASGFGTPTGQVTFEDGTTVIGQVPVNASGVAIFSTSSLAAGSHTVTAVYASDTNFAAGSGGTVQTVQALTVTSTTASSLPNPSSFGQSVTFTSTTTSSGGVPVGTVTFTEGATVWASNVLVNGSGQASFSTAALAVGSHTITATFTGGAGWGNSNGNAAPQVVNTGTITTTTATSSPNPSVFGQSVTFTSATTSGGGVPVGTVTFTEGATVWASNVPVNGSGMASFSTAALAVGSHTITATFTGGAGWANSSGNAAPQVVNAVATATTASSSPNPSVSGQSVTFTSTTTSGGGVPVGTVTFTEGATVWASNVPVNGSGQASFSTAALAVGSHTLTATFTGGAGWGNSSGNAAPQVVNKAATTTALGSSPNPSYLGQTVNFTATVAAVPPGSGIPTGTVTFKKGSTVLATVTLGSGVASYSTSTLAVGSDTITAVYSADPNFAASTGSTVQTVQALNVTTTTASASPRPSVFGQSVTFTSTTTSGAGLPVGTVNFTEGSTVWASNLPVNGAGQASFSTAALSVGSHTLTATFHGATGWADSSGKAAVQTVSKAATTTVLSSSANPSVYSQPVTFTAVVTANAPGAGIPTGTVTFKSGGANLGTGTLNGSGTATLTVSTLAVGTPSITADYGGSTNFSISDSTALTQTVDKDSTTSTVTSSLNPSTFGQSVTFTATVIANAPGTATPAGSVTFKDGVKTLGSANLSSGTAVFTTSTLTSGTHQITAVYVGNASFITSTSAVLVQTVN